MEDLRSPLRSITSQARQSDFIATQQLRQGGLSRFDDQRRLGGGGIPFDGNRRQPQQRFGGPQQRNTEFGLQQNGRRLTDDDRYRDNRRFRRQTSRFGDDRRRQQQQPLPDFSIDQVRRGDVEYAYVCRCDGDRCNGAAQMSLASSALLAVVGALLVVRR